jgi:hypothetical protein
MIELGPVLQHKQGDSQQAHNILSYDEPTAPSCTFVSYAAHI